MDRNQWRLSITQGQNICSKTPRISIKKHIKTASWQLSTYVPIKSHKNTVLIRVKVLAQRAMYYAPMQLSHILAIAQPGWTRRLKPP